MKSYTLFRIFCSLLPMPDLVDYTTTQDAASKLDLHVITVRRLLREKELDGLKVGRTWLVSKASMQAYQKRTQGMNKHDPRRSSQIG